ncbi:hypothetical protein CPB85DRAFT_1330635 [Mucidula mucida]|nr:hypothetical protein CPB85DRAFT_1330635 [Mucidula mucida]
MSSDTASSTSTAISPTSSPFLIFTGVSSLTACSSGSISWAYAGPQAALSLTITTIGVTQSDAPSSTELSSFSRTITRPIISNSGVTARAIPTSLTGKEDSDARTVVQLISGDVDPNAYEYTWDVVTVPQGWYTIYASMDEYPDFGAHIVNNFFVANGSDLSCLSSGASTTSDSPTSTSATPPPSDSSIPVVINSSVNKGAIAGGVVGGLAILSAVIAAYIFFVCAPARRRRSRPSSGVSGNGDRGIMGKWGALGSFDSTHTSSSKKKAKLYNRSPVLGGAPDPSRRHHSQADSGGPIMSVGSTTEDYNPYTEEKSASGHGIITVGYSPPRPSPMRQSNSSGSSDIYAMNYTRPHSSMMQTFPESPRPSTMDIDPPSRRASAGVEATQTPESKRHSRKTPRKPVPSYTPDAGDPRPMPSVNTTPTSQYHSPSPMDDSPTHSSQNLHDGSVEAVHHLIHKGSFGDGRPVHVLMPDMPPPQK